MMHATLGVGEAMGGEGFMHWLVAYRETLPHARFLPRVGPVPGARDRSRLAHLWRPARRALRLLLPALAHHPVRLEVQPGVGRDDVRLRRAPRALARRALLDPVVRLYPGGLLGGDEAPARGQAGPAPRRRGDPRDPADRDGLVPVQRVLRPLRLFPRRLHPGAAHLRPRRLGRAPCPARPLRGSPYGLSSTGASR